MPDIDYAIIRSARRRTLCINILPDNTVRILAPARMPEAIITSFVQKKHGWIRKKQHFNRHIRTPRPSRAFTPGESFKLLGENYRLSLKTAAKPHVEQTATALVVSLPDITDTTRISLLIEQWYMQQAENILTEICQTYALIIGVRFQSIGIKAYKSRWGTCHHDGRIYFNWRIIMAPRSVVTYIAVHELCHLIHHNHSQKFWQQVDAILPNYRESKTWLKINGLSLSL